MSTNVLHLINYLRAMYTYGRIAYATLGETSFIYLITSALVCTALASLSYSYLTNSRASTLPSSGHVIAVETFATLLDSGIAPSFTERALWTIGVPVLGHVFWDTVAIGGRLDWAGYAGGWVAGVVGYAAWGQR
ncbi:hypothetical protein HDU93_005977 [Gonapodya sp. JEL0774]|nr:hypothetical protein HDU93_005977 [Gonapodya sp. JEL0774]